MLSIIKIYTVFKIYINILLLVSLTLMPFRALFPFLSDSHYSLLLPSCFIVLISQLCNAIFSYSSWSKYSSPSINFDFHLFFHFSFFSFSIWMSNSILSIIDLILYVLVWLFDCLRKISWRVKLFNRAKLEQGLMYKAVFYFSWYLHFPHYFLKLKSHPGRLGTPLFYSYFTQYDTV